MAEEKIHKIIYFDKETIRIFSKSVIKEKKRIF